MGKYSWSFDKELVQFISIEVPATASECGYQATHNTLHVLLIVTFSSAKLFVFFQF
jgi:hypothetical protein